MSRGPKPTPTALRKLRGNPGKRPLPIGEPQPKSSLVDVRPPNHLSREAKLEWRRLAPGLIQLGLLTDNDLGAFTAYCGAWGDYVEAERALRRDGIITCGKEGQPVRSPWFLVKARSIDLMIRIGDRFGFTPSARVGLATDTGGYPLQRSSALADYLALKPDSLPTE